MIKPTSLLLILILCTSGYIILDSLPRTRYHFKKSSGYHTFLKSCISGGFVFILSSISYYAIDKTFKYINFEFSLSQLILEVFLGLNITRQSLILYDLSFISLSMGIGVKLYFVLLTYYQNTRHIENSLKFFSSQPENPEFTKLFFRSMEYGLPILFTLSDRKVYIGYINEIHATDFNDIHIIPIFSGYRSDIDLKVKLVTPYLEVLGELDEENIDEEIFCVSIPIREVVYAHLYDFMYQDKFSEKEENYSKGIHYTEKL